MLLNSRQCTPYCSPGENLHAAGLVVPCVRRGGRISCMDTPYPRRIVVNMLHALLLRLSASPYGAFMPLACQVDRAHSLERPVACRALLVTERGIIPRLNSVECAAIVLSSSEPLIQSFPDFSRLVSPPLRNNLIYSSCIHSSSIWSSIAVHPLPSVDLP